MILIFSLGECQINYFTADQMLRVFMLILTPE